MELAEILIVIVLISALWYMACAQRPGPSSVSIYDCMERTTGRPATVYVAAPNPADIGEHYMMSTALGNPEHLIANELKQHELMDAGSPVAAAGHSGAFTDWLVDTALDPQAKASHNQYVADRVNTKQTQNITGFLRPEGLTYDPVSWGGLNRPEAVPYGNPTNVPDIDHDWYRQNKRRLNL